jgi:hypothetical protein
MFLMIDVVELRFLPVEQLPVGTARRVAGAADRELGQNS